MFAFNCLQAIVLLASNLLYQAVLHDLVSNNFAATSIFLCHCEAPESLNAHYLIFHLRIILCHLTDILSKCALHKHARSVHFLHFDVAMHAIDAVDGDSSPDAVLLGHS